MKGCHFQDRPCHPSLCLRPLHLFLAERLCAPTFFDCDERTASPCPHRSWDHPTHLEVCRSRSKVVDECPSCGGRHRLMIEALRCEVSSIIENAFQTGSGVPDRSDELLGGHLPGRMRSSAWRTVREKVVERDARRCRRCGKDLAAVPAWLTEVHHIVPRCEGGSDHPSNLVTLCVMCHKRASVALRGERPARGEEWLPRETLSAFG